MSISYPPRQFVQEVAPAVEPLTLAEVKLFLRIDGNEEDRLIAGLIAVGRQKVEQHIRGSLLTQSWKLCQQYRAGEPIRLSLGPIQSITSVTLIENGVSQLVNSDEYSFASASDELTVSSSLQADSIEVVFVAGYEEVSDIPAPIKQGILQLIAHLYEGREEGDEIPALIRQLIQSYRKVSI